MDMTLRFDNKYVYNIRVMAICTYKDCYLMDNSMGKELIHIGGRLKYDETIKQAITREINEELGITVSPTLIGMCENFFEHEAQNCHEHLFVHKIDLSEYDLSNIADYIQFVKKEDIDKYIVYPFCWKKFETSTEKFTFETVIEHKQLLDKDICFVLGEKDNIIQEYDFRVSALIRKDNQILIDESARDMSHLLPIGGRLHYGETLEEGINREVEEELCTKIKNFKLRGIGEDFFIIHEDKHIHFISAVFEVELESENIVGADGSEPVWLDINEPNPSNTKMTSFIEFFNNKDTYHVF